MIAFLKFTLLLLGITYVITQSAAGTPVRLLLSKLGNFFSLLIYCPACTGFWVAATLAALGYAPWQAQSYYHQIAESAIAGCGLMAIWKEYGPQTNVWALEQPQDDSTQETTHG